MLECLSALWYHRKTIQMQGLCPTLDAASLEQKIKKSLCINPVSVYK